MTETCDLELLRAELARFTYRPGWQMSITDDAVLVVRYPVADARDPERMVILQNRRNVTDVSDVDELGRRLAQQLIDIETHESREWLRRDGVLFDDPHADPAWHHCGRCGGVGPKRREGSTWTCPVCPGGTSREPASVTT